MKDKNEVIAEFNEYVNMTASELEIWLKSDDSKNAGWPKDDSEDGESVGHESGRKIGDILESNPKKDPEKYTDDQIQHMGKVVSYCKRHLAQESSGNSDKDPEEVKKTKSYMSLKNWGHDWLKSQGGNKSTPKKQKDKDDDFEEKKEDDEEVEDKSQEDVKKDQESEDQSRKTRQQSGENKTISQKQSDGDDTEIEEEPREDYLEKDEEADNNKRKKNDQQNGANKKRQTSKGKGPKKDEDENDDSQNEDQDTDDNSNDNLNDKPSKNRPEKGQTVSWNWGNGQPHGKVIDVQEEK